MEPKFINNCMTADRVRSIKAELLMLETKKKRLQQELKTIQQTCNHDFIETAIMRKCRKCSWTESVYY